MIFERMKEIRTYFDNTQKELADYLKVSRSTYAGWENGIDGNFPYYLSRRAILKDDMNINKAGLFININRQFNDNAIIDNLFYRS